jgi:hypothetical protein
MGYDGWVKDAVAVLPELSEEGLDGLLVSLSRYMYGTSYGATVEGDQDGLSPATEQLDMSVTAAELRQWLLKGGETFSPTGEAPGVSVQTLLASRRYGEYLSTNPGFVLWLVPTHADITPHLLSARRWALDADLVLGGITDQATVAIIGRERQLPVSTLPPLRNETIRTLASSGTDHLAQSYERTFLLAGRFQEHDDWAPIYLSSTLIDDEYGSLLNITDQILKSRSEHGTIEYINFRYPAPIGYPFDRPLHEVLNVQRVTFNWNTRGAGYVTDEDGFRVYALNRTGSLPVSYFAGEEQEKTPATGAAEETAYAHFAGLNDPNLARVVQYAALYQLFREFQVGNQDPVPAPPRTQLALHDQVKNTLYGLASIDDAELVGGQEDSVSIALGRDLVLTLAKLGGEEAIDSLVQELLGGRQDETAQRERREFIGRAFINDTIRDGLSQEDYTRALRIYSAHPVRTILGALFGERSHAIARATFTRAAPAPTRSWIHTASIVQSRGEGDWVGGHNLDAAVTRFRASADVAPGEVRVIEEGGHPVLLVNEREVDRVSSNVRRVASAMEEGEDEAGLARLVSEMEARPLRPRLDVIPASVRSSGGRSTALRGGGQRIGWERAGRSLTQAENAASELLHGQGRQFVMVNKLTEGGFEIVSGDPPRVLFAPNMPSAVDALVSEARLAGSSERVPRLQLAGLSEQDALSLTDNVEREVRRLGRPREEELVTIAHEGSPQYAWLTKDADFSRAKVTSVREIPNPIEGRDARVFDVLLEVPTTSRPLHVRIRLWLEGVAKPVAERIHQAIHEVLGSLGGLSPDIAAARIKAAVAKVYGEPVGIIITAGDVTVVLRLPRFDSPDDGPS